jgi:nucleotide-binding universal stress UspA family protein
LDDPATGIQPIATGQKVWETRMAIKDIVVYLDASESGNTAEEFALSLAAQTGAHVTAVGISVKYLPFGMVQDVSIYDAFTQLTDESRAKIEAAYKKFDAAAPAGVQSELVVIEVPDQEASRRLGELGRHFDVSIVGQGTRFTQADVNLMVQGALFYSGKPLLIVSNNHTKARQNSGRQWCVGMEASPPPAPSPALCRCFAARERLRSCGWLRKGKRLRSYPASTLRAILRAMESPPH